MELDLRKRMHDFHRRLEVDHQILEGAHKQLGQMVNDSLTSTSSSSSSARSTAAAPGAAARGVVMDSNYEARVLAALAATEKLEERLALTWATMSAQQEQLGETLREHASVTGDLRRDVARLENALGGQDGRIAMIPTASPDPSVHSLPSSPSLFEETSPPKTPSWGLSGKKSIMNMVVASAAAAAAAAPSAELNADAKSAESPLLDGTYTWEMLEGDPNVKALIKDVRGKLTEYVNNNRRKVPTIADLESEGTLYLQLLSAKGLRSADENGLSDPCTNLIVEQRPRPSAIWFAHARTTCVSILSSIACPDVKLALGQQQQRSRKKLKTLNPVWVDEVFAFSGVLGQLIADPLKLSVWDFDLFRLGGFKDDFLGRADVELADHTYCNEVRRDMTVVLDTQGEVNIQLWWEPEFLDDQGPSNQKTRARTGRRSRGKVGGTGDSTWRNSYINQYVVRPLLWLIPEQFQSFRGCCSACCISVLPPESPFRTRWNLLLAIGIIYCSIAVPLEIAFEPDMVQAMCTDPKDPYGPISFRGNCIPYLQWYWGNALVDLFFIIDIVLNFRTGFMLEGHLVADDWEVAKAYVHGSFVMDAIGSFPINIVTMLANPDNPYGDAQIAEMQAQQAGGSMDAARANRMLRLVRMAKLTKLFRMRRLAKSMEALEDLGLDPNAITVVKLMSLVVFCCHLLGCLWWMVSDIERSEEELGPGPGSWLASPWHAGENNWHPPHWLKNDASVTMKYTYSFLWGAGMVTSLVPRDIEPVTVTESILTTACMFIGLLLNAYIISALNQALASMNAKRQLTGKQLDSIKTYLVLKAVPPALRARIMEYYEYLLTSSAALQDMNMFDQLPLNLSAQLDLVTSRRLTSRCSFFHNVSNASLVALIAEFKACVYIPDQGITMQGTPLTACFFINKGMVQISTHDGMQTNLTNTDNFGFSDYYASCIAKMQPRCTQTAKAVTYCDLTSLDVETIDDALKHDTKFKDVILEARRAAAAAARSAMAAKARNLVPNHRKIDTRVSGVAWVVRKLTRTKNKWPKLTDKAGWDLLRRKAASDTGQLVTTPPVSNPVLVRMGEEYMAELNTCLELARYLRHTSDSSHQSRLRATFLRATARLEGIREEEDFSSVHSGSSEVGGLTSSGGSRSASPIDNSLSHAPDSRLRGRSDGKIIAFSPVAQPDAMLKA